MGWTVGWSWTRSSNIFITGTNTGTAKTFRTWRFRLSCVSSCSQLPTILAWISKSRANVVDSDAFLTRTQGEYEHEVRFGGGPVYWIIHYVGVYRLQAPSFKSSCYKGGQGRHRWHIIPLPAVGIIPGQSVPAQMQLTGHVQFPSRG